MTTLTTDHPALALLRELLPLPSPPGHEALVARWLMQWLTQRGLTPEQDATGNVTVRLPGRDPARPLWLLAAHMDEIGAVVTAIEPDGKLRVDRNGALWPYKLGERAMTVLGDHGEITAIASIGSTHTADAATRSVTWADLRLITGLTPAQLAAHGVRPGSPTVPHREGRGPVLLGCPDDPLVAAWTFDDRLGVVTLLRLLDRWLTTKQQPAGPTLIAFTIHEEGGCHGAKVLAQRERPEVFLAIDGCPLLPGSGININTPATWAQDMKCVYDPRLVRRLIAIGEQLGAPVQSAVLKSAMSDASAVYDVGAAARVAVFGHVRDNSHGYEVTRLGAADQTLDILAALCADPQT